VRSSSRYVVRLKCRHCVVFGAVLLLGDSGLLYLILFIFVWRVFMATGAWCGFEHWVAASWACTPTYHGLSIVAILMHTCLCALQHMCVWSKDL